MGREEDEGAGEEGAGEVGRDGGGAGHGEGETSGGESGDVIIQEDKGVGGCCVMVTPGRGEEMWEKLPLKYCLICPKIRLLVVFPKTSKTLRGKSRE